MTYVTQGSIPEVIEKTLGDSLLQRTSILENINDLGPPDMVHLNKTLANQSNKTTPQGTFFYYTGCDVSNSATVAALLNSLANIIHDEPQIWFGKPKNYKVNEAVYCSYNAFSKIDTRVKVDFPGSVESSMVDQYGNKVEENDEYWLETFISAMVRSLVTSDDDSSDFTSIVEIRKINPLLAKESIDLFLTGFEELFFNGYKLGCDEDLQIANDSNNYLIDAFVKAIQLTGYFGKGIEILNRLKLKDTNINYLIAKLYLLADKEIVSIGFIHEQNLKTPLDYNLLILQSEYCIKKNRLDLALPIAIKAVNSAPSFFKPWSILVKIYILLNKFDQALLTLNSCPMVTHKDKFMLKRINNPSSNDLHLPLPLDVNLKGVSNLNSMDVAIEHNKIDQNLLGLPAGNLKSTFSKAYQLLTEIVHKTGWENLLKYRTRVFVMEDEFKKEKTLSKTNLNASLTTLNNTKESINEVVNIENDFKKKRLCERWLDNLFMLLYEDLRIYTMYKAELIHFESQEIEIKKSCLEWELIGLVSYRLGHIKESVKCFEKAIENRFSVRSSKKLIEYYTNEKFKSTDITKINILNDKILKLTIKLLVWNHRWYCSFSPNLITSLKNLVADVGRVKLENEIKVRFDDDVNTGVYNLVKDNLEFLDTYGLIEGEDE